MEPWLPLTGSLTRGFQHVFSFGVFKPDGFDARPEIESSVYVFLDGTSTFCGERRQLKQP